MQIDSLEVSVKSSATSAIKALDSLQAKLMAVSRTMSNVNGSGMNAMASGIRNLGDAVNSVKNIDTRTYSALARNIDKLSRVNAGGLRQAAGSIRYMGDALAQLNNNANVANLSQLATALRQLGYKSINNAITNMPRLAQSLKELMNTLKDAPRVSRNLIDMTNALARLGQSANGLNQLSRVTNSATRSITTGFMRSGKSMKSLAYYFGKFYANYFLLYRLFRRMKKAIDISADMTEVQNVVTMTFGQMTDKVEEFANTSIQNFGMSSLSAKQFASRFQAMGSAMGIPLQGMGSSFEYINKRISNMSEEVRELYTSTDGITDMSLNLSKLAGDMASFYNVEQKLVATDLEAIFTGQARPLRKFGIDLTEATVQTWALNHGMQVNMKTMTQQQKTLLRYQYVMSSADKTMNDFRRTSNTWSNQTRLLTENVKQLGSVWGQAFINMLKPLVISLNKAIAIITQFSVSVVNALGKIFGWKAEVQKVSISEDFENADEAIQGATNSAKKLKSALSIDELNIISDNGGGADGLDATASGFEDRLYDIKQTESLFESSIKNMAELGNYFSQSIIEALDKIEWDTIKNKFYNFGKSVAEFFNSLFTPETVTKIVKSIVETINSGLKMISGFIETFDWKQLGVNVGASLNTIFDTFDFAELAKALNNFVDGIEDAIAAAIKEFDGKKAVGELVKFLEHLDIDTIAVVIGILKIRTIKKIVIEHLWPLLVRPLKEMIGKALLAVGGLGNLLTLDIAALIGETGWATAGLLIGSSIIGGIIAAFSGWKIGNKIWELISGEKYELSFSETVKEIFTSFSDGSWKEALSYFQEDFINIINTFNEGIKKGVSAAIDKSILASAIKETKEDIDSMIKYIDETLIPGIKNIGPKLVSLWADFVDWWHNTAIYSFWENDVKPWFTVDKWSELFANIKSAAMAKWDELKQWWNQTFIVRFWNERVIPKFTKNYWETKFQSIKDGAITKWEDIKKWYQENVTKRFWENKIVKIFTKEYWTEKFNTIQTGAMQKWSDIKQWYHENVVQHFLNETLKPKLTKDYWVEQFKGIKDGLVTIITNAIRAAADKINKFIDWINDKLDISWDGYSIAGKEIFPAGHMKMFSIPRIPEFATGGFPEDGLFMANGSELVGSFSDGRTAVANNEQIVSGIAYGVREAIREEISQYLDRLVSSNDEIARKDLSVNIGDRDISRANLRGSQQMGLQIVTVGK